jgi:HEAT repeat protein
MRKNRNVLLIAVLVCVVGGFIWFLLRPSEPVYQGKGLSYWLKDLEDWDGDTNNAAFVAFSAMGTNAIPPLLEILKSGGPPIQKMILEANRKQSVIDLPYGTPWIQTVAAAWALYAIGTNAQQALPELTNLLFRTNASTTSATALAGIGPTALPSLLSALTNQNDRIRYAAASGLGRERSDFNIVVPALIARLQDKSSMVRSAAVISLGHLHAEPELAVPALIKDFSSNDNLHRRLILTSLGEFESKAKESEPMILDALNDSDESVRQSAAFAIKNIDPEAAAKAGVK